MNWGQSVRFGKRAILLGGAAALLWAAPAAAQNKQRYTLPAGDASSAVQRLAVQSGLQVMAPNDDLSGITTNPVDGTYTPVEALRQMLANKGLTVSVSSEGTVVIRKAGSIDTAQASTGNDIVVTGSRIERAGFDTLQSASVVDAKQIERRAYTNAIEALQDTPGFAPAANSQIGAAQANLSVAQSYSNYLGLGSQRTLTLVNGRRYVSSNSVSGSGGAGTPGSQVDLNLIPVGLIERIETVAIGGAPVYGSDAIAGTVNVILKDNYDGLELTAQASISERGDAANQSVRGLFGKNFAGGRGNIVLGAEYVRQEGMVLADRFKFRYLSSSGNTNRTDGIPAQLIVGDLRYAALTEGGLPYKTADIAPSTTSYIRDAAGNPLQFGSDGNLVPLNLGGSFFGASSGPYAVLRDGGDGLNPARHFSLLSPNERYLINAIGHYDLTDNITFFVEGSYAHTSGTKLSDLFQFAAPNILGGPVLTMSASNPFLTQQARDILAANGVTSFKLNRNMNDIADRTPGRTKLDVYRIVAGFKGDFNVAGERWNWDLAYNYGRSRNESEFNQVNLTRFLQAIDVVGTATAPTCRVGGSCVPLNIFGENAFSDAAAEYVVDRGIGISVNSLQTITANLGGKLPFGIAEPIAFNIGYEHRREYGSFTPDATLKGGISLLGGSAAFTQTPPFSFHTNEVYGETIVPLIDEEMGLPLIRAAQFEGALRYVDHSTAGGDLTWSAGGRIQPNFVDGLTFRGVYTRAIRAPSIVELALPGASVLRNASDVCAASRVNSGPNPAVRLANCTAALAAVGGPAPNLFNPTTSNASPSGNVAGNLNLENEKANSWSIGLVYQPPSIPRLRFAIDYNNIDLRDAITRFTLLTAQAACYDSPNYPNENACQAFSRLTAAQAAAQPGPARIAGDIANGYSESYFNTASQKFAGVLAQLDYGIEVLNIISSSGDQGLLRLGLGAFHVTKFTTQNSSGSPIINVKGTLGTPEWRFNARVGYAFDPFDLDVQVVWSQKTAIDNTATVEDLPFLQYPSSTIVNSTLGFRVNENFRLQFSIRNLFDQKVPYEAQVTRAFGVYDPIGRTFTVRASANF
jgi:iron complex outermembrane receptor protein